MTASPRLSERATKAAGQPIGYLMQHALEHPEVISLAAGFVDQQTLPVDATRAALEAVLSSPERGRPALQYGTTAGYQPLREAVLERLLEADGHPESERGLSVEQVVVTAGSNQLLHLLVDTLCEPGDIVLCSAPSYFVFLGIVDNLGVESVGVATDDHGLIPAGLEEALRRLEASGDLPRVKAIYVVSDFDNPAGGTLAAERRAEIVELTKRWSKKQKIYVLEDAAYRELRYYGNDLASLRAYDDDGETVVLTQTFSKSFSPGIRVGWGILPPSLVDPIVDQKSNIDFGSPNFSQHLMNEVVRSGGFDEHVARLRGSYRLKLDAMLEAADEHLAPLPGVAWCRPEGGLYVWLQLPEEIHTGPEGNLFDRALSAGTLYVPGQYCYPRHGVARRNNMIRLSFGVQTPERIRLGIEALAAAVAQQMME